MSCSTCSAFICMMELVDLRPLFGTNILKRRNVKYLSRGEWGGRKDGCVCVCGGVDQDNVKRMDWHCTQAEAQKPLTWLQDSEKGWGCLCLPWFLDPSSVHFIKLGEKANGLHQLVHKACCPPPGHRPLAGGVWRCVSTFLLYLFLCTNCRPYCCHCFFLNLFEWLNLAQWLTHPFCLGHVTI